MSIIGEGKMTLEISDKRLEQIEKLVKEGLQDKMYSSICLSEIKGILRQAKIERRLSLRLFRKFWNGMETKTEIDLRHEDTQRALGATRQLGGAECP